MKKIFESELHGWDESAERVHVYELENEDEYEAIEEMSHWQRCELFNVSEEWNVMPGAMYHRYYFHLGGNHIVMTEHVAYNV